MRAHAAIRLGLCAAAAGWLGCRLLSNCRACALCLHPKPHMRFMHAFGLFPWYRCALLGPFCSAFKHMQDMAHLLKAQV
jgi:hypothetical protein